MVVVTFMPFCKELADDVSWLTRCRHCLVLVPLRLMVTMLLLQKVARLSYNGKTSWIMQLVLCLLAGE